MRYGLGHKAEARRRILDAAGRAFRTSGYGVGVDGLAREAGVTSGAFYGHFRSKAEAFRAAVTAGLRQLGEGIQTFRTAHGADWVPAFAAYYMDEKRTCAPGESCALPSLSPEVARADLAARSAYEDELAQIAALVAAGLEADGESAPTDRAWALLALLSGGMMLARAVPDQAVAERIALAVRDAAVVVASARRG